MSFVVGGGDVCWVELVDEAAKHDVAGEVEGIFFVGHSISYISDVINYDMGGEYYVAVLGN